jgi:protein SERAC1
MTWGYDSSVAQTVELSSQNSLFGHAENLLTDLSSKRRGDDEYRRPILFIGHSMGGLVIKQVRLLEVPHVGAAINTRQALIRSSAMYQNGQDGPRGALSACTSAVIFLGTPHRGSDKESLAGVVARLAHLAYRMPNRQLLETLARDSHILENQRSAFDSVSNKLSIVCFYEEIPTAIGIVSFLFDDVIFTG